MIANPSGHERSRTKSRSREWELSDSHQHSNSRKVLITREEAFENQLEQPRLHQRKISQSKSKLHLEPAIPNHSPASLHWQKIQANLKALLEADRKDKQQCKETFEGHPQSMKQEIKFRLKIRNNLLDLLHVARGGSLILTCLLIPFL